MNLADLKKLRSETGASLSECKRALETGDTFEDAIELARQFASEREQTEQAAANEQQRQKAEFYAAEEKKDTFVKALTKLEGVYDKDVRRMLQETNDDWAAVQAHFEAMSKVKEAERVRLAASLRPESKWSAQTPFRSDLTLGGSSKVSISFECVQDAKIRFTLDMASGVMSDLRDWHPYLNMPGDAPNDPEPLGVWCIYSEDERFEIQMQEAYLSDLYVDGEWVKMAEVSTHPEVSALLKVLTNVAVRDLWISAH